jgi:hypothetical protein
VHLDETLAGRLWLKAAISIEPLADFKILGRHRCSHCLDRVRRIPRVTGHAVLLPLRPIAWKQIIVAIALYTGVPASTILN